MIFLCKNYYYVDINKLSNLDYQIKLVLTNKLCEIKQTTCYFF